MEFILKLSYFCLLLRAATGQFQIVPVSFRAHAENPEDMSRQFHVDKDKDTTRDTIKSEMELYFSNLSQTITTSNIEILSKLETLNRKLDSLNERMMKIEINQEESTATANSSLTFSENAGVDLLDSFHKCCQSSSDLKTEMSLRNLSATITQKLSTTENVFEASLANLSALLTKKLRGCDKKAEISLRNHSQSFDGNLVISQSKVTDEIWTLNETLQRNHQQLSSCLSNLAALFSSHTQITTASSIHSTVESETELIPIKQWPTQTEVEEVNLEEGTIEFTGGANPHLRRKIWVIQSEGGTSFPDPVRFMLEENGLGEDARLSVWGLDSEEGGSRKWEWDVWTGSQSDWRKERTNKGNVILVTLLISPSAVTLPSFKLKFQTQNPWPGAVSSSQLVVGEGRQVVSFPPYNSQDFLSKSLFVAVVARPSGKPFQMKLKFLDLPGTPPDSCVNMFRVNFLEECSSGRPYKLLPPSALRRCGQVGEISEPIGNSNATVAIVWFWGNGGSVGKGFRIEII